MEHARSAVVRNPSNHKCFRNLAVSQITANTVEGLRLTLPPPMVDLADIRQRYHADSKEEKAGDDKRA